MSSPDYLIIRLPDEGALVLDTATSKVGVYVGLSGPYALLRPEGGGREWEADPEKIIPVKGEA
ncbi:hypothetical protein [Streptomyces europaeiscabiei]|uniref:hypothetical protein n=1 Tax=Streptomyces europaeiscabiei TaxID=146819 RepID=UPI002E199AE1